jgi:sulfur carrier protein
MNLILNGEKRNLTGIETISELLESLRLSAGLVLVEQNGEVVQRAQYGATNLVEGDRIEIVRVVAGG